MSTGSSSSKRYFVSIPYGAIRRIYAVHDRGVGQVRGFNPLRGNPADLRRKW